MAKRVQEGPSYAQSVVDLAVLGHPTNCKHAFDHIQSEELFGEDRDPVLEAFNEEEKPVNASRNSNRLKESLDESRKKNA